MKSSKNRPCRRGIPTKHVAHALVFLNGQRGFTLIELMIGLALGLIASLAIFSTVSTFESQRRTTGSGVDMQQNGLMALYSIEQDIRVAGFGLIDASTTPGNMPCSRINDYRNNTVFNSSPVVLANGSTGTDIITINRLNSDTGGIVTGGNAAGLSQGLSAGTVPSSLYLDTSAAMHNNDFILVSETGLDCSLLKVSLNPSATIGASGVDVVSAGNAIVNTAQSPSFPAYTTNAVVANLGPASSVAAAAAAATTFGSTNPTVTPSFATTTYQISNDGNFNLTRSENGGAPTVVASNITTVATQYGVANTGSLSVSCWTDATGNACSGTDWSNPPIADVKRIKAIRVAIVARSSQPAGTCTASTQPTTWAGLTATQTGIANWGWGGCYRYKIYQTIIPIRNVIWGNL